jgi:hypothetical protein
VGAQVFVLWVLVIVAATLAGWWLAVRPQASYRGIATPISFLIIIAAILMCVLALSSPRAGTTPLPPSDPPAALNR